MLKLITLVHQNSQLILLLAFKHINNRLIVITEIIKIVEKFFMLISIRFISEISL